MRKVSLGLASDNSGGSLVRWKLGVQVAIDPFYITALRLLVTHVFFTIINLYFAIKDTLLQITLKST